MLVKKWRGLVKREWASMKWRVVPLVLANSVIVFLTINHVFSGVLGNYTADIQFTIGFSFVLHFLAAVSWFLDGLNKEMKQPDIWLHSPTPMWQLAGAKVLFYALAIACSFALSGVIIVISYSFGDGLTADNIELVLSVGTIILLNVMYAMALIFFFWAIYQVFRSRINWFFTFILMLVSFIIWAYAWGMIWFTGVFQNVKKLVPLNDELIMLEPNYIVPGGAILTLGSMVLYGAVTVVYLVIGSMLFEKKVRL